MNAKSVVLVPYGSDPLAVLAALMLERHRRELPDLSAHTVLLPGAGAIPCLREALLAAAEAAGAGGLLAPWCGTFDTWLEQHADGAFESVDESERELLLLEALADFPRLRERYGTWPLVDSLLALFDELNAQHAAPPETAEALAARLASGYGVPAPLAPLTDEARLVHSLWSAWNAHLAARRLQDRAQRRRAALARAPTPGGESHHIYVVGAIDIAGAQAQWLRGLIAARRATVVLHGGARADGYHPDAAVRRCLAALDAEPPEPAEPDTPYARLLDAVYAADTDIGGRARRFAADAPTSPLAERLHVFVAGDFEQEARAIDLAVRRWRLQGVQRIGILTADRKLARRVRALLERANIGLRDAAGWALSTTSAATVLMRWIECVEQDFPQASLLDFLKSPFVTLGFPRPQLESLAHAFEERVVRRRNISGGLQRYRRALLHRPPARADEPDETSHDAALGLLLDRLADAAAPLERLLGSASRPPSTYLGALESSLARAGVLEGLAADAAGAQLLAALRARPTSAAGARLDWREFHDWLTRELERRRFRPPLPASGVELLDFPDSRCRRFDALVIAGCTRDNLPGTLATSPFFNDAVRAGLGLPTREERLLAPLHDFRRALEAAPRVLLTWRRFERDEEIVASPWTERLIAFHRLAYGTVPHDAELLRLLSVEETALYRRDDGPLPHAAVVPAPPLPRERVPAALSASSHQRLLDCPYQFYVADGLGLRALDDVRDEMEKSDYGKNVHRILHAFHTGIAGLPGPWRDPVTRANRAAAAALLRDIGRRVFAYDSDRRLSTRGWRHRWEQFIDAYLDWHEQRAAQWQVEATERTLERELTVGEHTIVLKGRADRIDRGGSGASIVDYKTGQVPDAAAVATGESTQLPFYALLQPASVVEVVYAQLKPEGVRTVSLGGEELATLVPLLEQRLRTVIRNIDEGARLPAWGDPQTCRFCRFEGVCRKEMWEAEGDRVGGGGAAPL